MKRSFAIIAFAVAASSFAADDPAMQVADDARVIRRVAEVSKRDFPKDIAERIVDEDLELLRGRRSDGTYRYAHFEREEQSRVSDRFAIRSRDENRPDEITYSGERVYRAVISVPSRRLLVARNRRTFIDRVDVEYTPFDAPRKSTSIRVGSWVAVGEQKSIDIPAIAKRAKITVYARVDEKEEGPATIDIALLSPKLVDDATSPYASAVQSLKALQRAVDRRELAQIKSNASDLESRLNVAPRVASPAEPSRREIDTLDTSRIDTRPSSTMTVTSSRLESTPQIEIYLELQGIEDLLTGTEGERREGLDRLHQLVRKLRQEARN